MSIIYLPSNAFGSCTCSQAVKANKRQGVGSRKHVSITEEFPLAKLNGPTSSELTELWEAKRGNSERQGKSQSTPLYEKVGLLVAL